MPIYKCYSRNGVLTESARQQIAKEITTIHCEATGAPPSFVNVMFLEIPAGGSFVAGQPSTRSVIEGYIRAGRDIETRQGMLRALSEMWTRLSGQSEADLVVGLDDIPSENVMEAGLIFPQPGHEQRWFDENRARLTELGWTAA
jgi:phenylpyruvate tautomerase PptA (4-oxalocrotonate tautomerase family)